MLLTSSSVPLSIRRHRRSTSESNPSRLFTGPEAPRFSCKSWLDSKDTSFLVQRGLGGSCTSLFGSLPAHADAAEKAPRRLGLVRRTGPHLKSVGRQSGDHLRAETFRAAAAPYNARLVLCIPSLSAVSGFPFSARSKGGGHYNVLGDTERLVSELCFGTLTFGGDGTENPSVNSNKRRPTNCSGGQGAGGGIQRDEFDFFPLDSEL